MPDRAALLPAGARGWLDRLLVPLARGETILDLACGGGEPIDRYLIDHGFRIVGIDDCATSIALARTRFPRERWLLADMRTISLNESFAAVIAWNSLPLSAHGHADAMAERIMGWLRPGGRLLFSGDASAVGAGAALTRRGMVEIAHAEHDPSCDGAGVWLLRKP
jgi:SAM-dependent methyltransferase